MMLLTVSTYDAWKAAHHDQLNFLGREISAQRSVFVESSTFSAGLDFSEPGIPWETSRDGDTGVVHTGRVAPGHVGTESEDRELDRSEPGLDRREEPHLRTAPGRGWQVSRHSARHLGSQ